MVLQPTLARSSGCDDLDTQIIPSKQKESMSRKIPFWQLAPRLALVGAVSGELALPARVSGENSDNAVPAAVQSGQAGDKDIPQLDPFLAIAKRNPFGIKPPLPPPVQEAAPPPPPPPSNLFLTGISVINGIRRAFLVQVEANGKPPKYLTLDDAHGMQDGLKLLGIDIRKRIVHIQNGTEEVALNFKDNAWKGTGGGGGPAAPGGPPGMRQLPQGLPPGAHQPIPAAASSGPTIIRRGGGIGRVDAGANGGNLDFSGSAVNSGDFGGTRELPQRQAVYLGGSTSGANAGNSTAQNPAQVVQPVYNPIAGAQPGSPVPPAPPPIRH